MTKNKEIDELLEKLLRKIIYINIHTGFWADLELCTGGESTYSVGFTVDKAFGLIADDLVISKVNLCETLAELDFLTTNTMHRQKYLDYLAKRDGYFSEEV